MKVILNGVEIKFIGHQNVALIPTPETKHGFNAHITFKEEEPQIRCNCTEIHFNYNGKRTAFESDIHGTGGTKLNNDILSVVITNATKEHFSHFEL